MPWQEMGLAQTLILDNKQAWRNGHAQMYTTALFELCLYLAETGASK